MKFSRLTLAIAATLGASTSFNALAIDLYVDIKTKQIYAEPGRGRELMGSFEKVGEKTAPAAVTAPVATQAEVAAIKEDLALKTNEIKALSEYAAEANSPESAHISLKDGIHFATKDGNFTAGINGRLQVDSQINEQTLPNAYQGIYSSPLGTPVTLNNGATLRRARLGVEGTFFKNTDYKFEYDFTRGNGFNAGGITDAFIRYNFSKPFSLKVGSFKEPFSLEEATSNRYTTFIERNMAVNTFVDNLNTYKVGIGANYAVDRWQIGSSFQTEGIGGYSNAYGSNGMSATTGTMSTTGSACGNNGGVNRSGGCGDTSWEFNTRVSGTPWMESKTKFLHVGASGSYIDVNNNYTGNGAYNNGGIIFANGLGGNVDRTAILNTGNLTNGAKISPLSHQANTLSRFGGESALVYGPFSAQGEYIQTNVLGKGYDNASLAGYYGYMTYFLTGESRNYKAKTGAWDRIKPNRNFDMKGGWGAWEVATGYDYMNLNSGGFTGINGGQASTVKFGLNWYPHSHVRIMADYVHALNIDTANARTSSGLLVPSRAAAQQAWNHASLDMIETRVQLDW